MGNRKCKPPRPIPTYSQPVPPPVQPVGGSVRSMSNESFVATVESRNEHVELTPSQEFDEEHLEELYFNFIKNQQDNKLSTTNTKPVLNIFESLSMDENILQIAQKFNERFVLHYENFVSNFSDGTIANKMKIHENLEYSTEQRMILHTMYCFRFHIIILQALEDGKEENMHELLNLLALSHMILNIDQAMFKVLAITLMQNLLHFSLLTEDQLPPLVWYHVRINKIVLSAIKEYKRRHDRYIKDDSGVVYPSRENYKDWKKWKAIVFAIRKSLSKPITQYEMEIIEEKKKVKKTKVDEDVHLPKFVRLLKLGYKYKCRRKVGESSA